MLAIPGAVGIITVLIALGTLIWRVASLSAQLTSKVEQLTEAKIDVARLHALEVARAMNENALSTLSDRIRNIESHFPRQLRGSSPDLKERGI